MTKNIPAELVTESQKDAVSSIILLKLEFDSGEVRVHTNNGDITFDGQVYSGLGDFGSFSPVEENSELSSSSINVSLSGVKNSLISIFLNDDFHGRPATMFFGFKDSSNVLINAFIVFKGFMDTDTIVSGETSTISLKLTNNLALWDRRKLTLNNNEDHQKDSPGDNFFEFVEDLRNRTYTWEKGSRETITRGSGLNG